MLRNSVCVSLSISRGWEVQVPTFRARKATHHTHSQGGGGVNLLLFGLSLMFIQNLFLHYSLQCVKVVILHLWQSGSVTSFPFHILKQLHLLNRHTHTHTHTENKQRFTSAKSFSLKEQALPLTKITMDILLEMVPNLIIVILLDFFSLTITGCTFQSPLLSLLSLPASPGPCNVWSGARGRPARHSAQSLAPSPQCTMHYSSLLRGLEEIMQLREL